MNSTSAVARSGESTLGVLVTLPQWSDLASVESRCRAKLSSLVFNLVPPAAGPPAPAPAPAAVVAAVVVPVAPVPPLAPVLVRYAARVFVDVKTRTYPFSLVTVVVKNNTAKKLADKFTEHMGRGAVAYFPLHTHLPRLYYVGEDLEPDDPHFEMEIPPFTMFYTSSPNFWAGIGFTGAGRGAAAPWSVQRKIGGRQKKMVTVMVHGFANTMMAGSTGPVVLRGERMYPNQLLGASLPPGTPMGPSLQFQVEVMEMKEQEVDLTMRMGVTKHEVVVGLTRLLEEARVYLGLENIPIDVNQGYKNAVELTTTPHLDCKVRLFMTLADELSDALGHPRNLPLIFDFEMPSKTIEIRVPGDPQQLQAPVLVGPAAVVVAPQTTGRWDPFRGRYPILVVLRGYGHSKSFVRDSGYLTLLGRVEERKGVVPAEGIGMEITASQTVLSVEFLDCERQLVVFDRDMTANFIFDFVRLF